MAVHRRTSRGDVATAYAFVATQFGLLAALAFWDPRPDFTLPRWLDTAAQFVGLAGAAWIGLGAVALGRSLTALPLPVAHGRLETRGLYRLSRHPIYTGVLALAWSWAVRSAANIPLALAAALNVLLVTKARLESGSWPTPTRSMRSTPDALPVSCPSASGSRPGVADEPVS